MPIIGDVQRPQIFMRLVCSNIHVLSTAVSFDPPAVRTKRSFGRVLERVEGGSSIPRSDELVGVQIVDVDRLLGGRVSKAHTCEG